MSVTIRFENIGRNKMTWTESFVKMDYDLMLRAINRKCALGSRGACFVHDANRGIVLAGDHNIGSFRVLPEEDLPRA